VNCEASASTVYLQQEACIACPDYLFLSDSTQNQQYLTTASDLQSAIYYKHCILAQQLQQDDGKIGTQIPTAIDVLGTINYHQTSPTKDDSAMAD